MLAAGVASGLAVVIFRDVWSKMIAPGASGDVLALSGEMLAIMGVSIPFYIHTNLAAYLEMSHGRQRIISLRPTFQSVGLIVGTLLAFLLSQPLWLAGGFTVAYVLMSIWATLRVRYQGFLSQDSTPIRWDDWKTLSGIFVRSIAPLVGLPVMMQGAWVGERAIASFSDSRAVAALDYARLITDTANVLVAWPVGLVILTAFADLDRAALNSSLRLLGDRLLLVGILLSGLGAVWAHPLVVLVYQRGAFDAHSSMVTTEILVGLTAGLWAQTLTYIHVKALNAMVRNGLAALVCGVGAAGWLVGQLLLTPLLGPFGLGLGASAGAVVQLLVSSCVLGQGQAVMRRCVELLPVLVLGVVGTLFGWSASLAHQGVIGLFTALGMLAWVCAVPALRNDLVALVRRD